MTNKSETVTLAEVDFVLTAMSHGIGGMRAVQERAPNGIAAQTYALEMEQASAIVDRLRKQISDGPPPPPPPPQFTAIRGARPGDVVFLTPARDLSADEAKRLCNALHEFSLQSRIHTVILPMGFSVNGKPTEDDVCVYTPLDEGPGGNPTRYDTACQKIWHTSSCSELHPFCAYCGKPISVAPFSTDPTPRGE